jgi:hypothetical protein
MAIENTQVPPLEIPSGILPGVRQALRHWHEHRPSMYTELYHKGTLIETAIAAYELMLADLEDLQTSYEKEYDASTAFVLAKKEAEQRYIYLPTEEDVPDLMTSPEGIPFYQSDQSG